MSLERVSGAPPAGSGAADRREETEGRILSPSCDAWILGHVIRIPTCFKNV